MKCAVHPDAEAIGYCRNCGKPLCSTCARPIRDVYYCEDCLAGAVGIPPAPSSSSVGAAPGATSSSPYSSSSSAGYVPPVGVPGAPIPPPPTRRITSPALAFVLGLCVPGLGAIYNGEYNKALIQIVVFASIIVGLSSDIGGSADTALAFLLAGFVFYMAFDSMQTAKNKAAGVASSDPLEAWSKDRPIGAIILIGVGVLFLLNNFSWFPFYRIGQFWPLILIGVGIMMFRNRLSR
jgi:TM2 domain-containing membrane protein YozV